jgi:fatty acid synthase
VVTEKIPWTGSLAGVSSLGFGGANGHVVLKQNQKNKVNGGAPADLIPRLVVASGRTEEAVDVILTDVSRSAATVSGSHRQGLLLFCRQ